MPSDAGRPATVIVTGCSSGIGLATTGLLLAQGWRVLGWDRDASPALAGPFVGRQVDLSEPNQVDVALRSLAEPVHAFVHAAGWMRTASLQALDLAAGAAMWQVHVQAAHQLARRLAPAMAERGDGRVVLIGSRVAALVGFLLSGQAAAITGQDIQVCGGASLPR